MLGDIELPERHKRPRTSKIVSSFSFFTFGKLMLLRGSKSFLKGGQRRVGDINNLELRSEGTKGPIMENCYTPL
jgi:hypothetical protein